MEHIQTQELQYRGESNLGQMFDHAVICSVSTPTHWFRILYDQHGNPLTNASDVYSIARYYGLQFHEGTIDGVQCYLEKEACTSAYEAVSEHSQVIEQQYNITNQ
jgi:hypothetical protein